LRGYVFTGEERKILNAYVKRSVKIKHFNVIMTLIRRNQDNLEQDLKLLNAVTKKLKSKSKKRRRR
jgi:hypothetical protein